MEVVSKSKVRADQKHTGTDHAKL